MQFNNANKEEQHNIDIENIVNKCHNKKNKQLGFGRYAGPANKHNGYWIQALNLKDWTELKILHLNGCKIDESNISNLANKQWPNLQKLYMLKNKIQSNAVKIFIQNNTFTSLILLNLSSNQIGSRGAKWLAKIQLPIVQQIELMGCYIEDAGAQHLIKSSWPSLQMLWLHHNQIKLTGWQALSAYCGWRILKKLGAKGYGEKEQYIAYICFVVLPGETLNCIFKQVNENQQIYDTIKQIWKQKQVKK